MASSEPSRIGLLAQAMQDAGVDAYLAQTPVSMGYLTGFAEDAHERFLALAIRADGQCCLICPALSEAQARRAGIADIRAWRDGEAPLTLFQDLANEWDLGTAILAVDDHMPAKMVLEMQEAMPAALFKPGGALLTYLRRKKSAAEIALMRRAAKIADETFQACLSQIRPGISERELGRWIESDMAARGGSPDFCILGAGANGAEPHHSNDDTKLKEGDVIILDFGCSVEQYRSDITRVVAVGSADPEAHKVYNIVLRAHNAGFSAAKSGATSGSVDAACREVIEQAGYGQFFNHRTGHGIGIEGHEEPYIVGGSNLRLEVGDCFSIEPGIYLPGRFGVRLENIVTLTEHGPESLNEDPSPVLVEVR